MMAKQYMLALTTSVMFFLLTASGAMASQNQCLTCHQDVRNAAMEQMFIHEPVAKSQCKGCHSANPEDTIYAEPVEQELIDTDSNDNEWIKWLAESFVESTQQTALLPVGACNSPLTIKLWYQNRSKQQSTINCPEVSTIPIKSAPPQVPTISQLHLSNYNDKLFTRATLVWATDAPCRCQLIYKFDEHQYVQHEDDLFTNNHNQEIRNFNPSNTNIAVECTDTFQQQTQSKFVPLTALPLRNDETIALTGKSSAEFTINYYRIAGNIEISIKTNQPATISIGQTEHNQEPMTTNQQEQNQPLHSGHSPLANEKQLNTTICFKCHRSTVEVSSHPINVLPPLGMIIPPEYPLLSNGMLTCMTCHSRHSSNNEARLIKQSKKALCTGCHTNY